MNFYSIFPNAYDKYANLGDPSPLTASYPTSAGNPPELQLFELFPSVISLPTDYNLYKAVFKNPNGPFPAAYLFALI